MSNDQTGGRTVPGRNHGQLKPFTKGDPRINRKGRPKTIAQVRELAQQIADEVVLDKDGNPVVLNGHILTQVELLLRALSKSKDLRGQLAFLEYAYGKPPQVNEHTGEGGGPVQIKVTYVDRNGGDVG